MYLKQILRRLTEFYLIAISIYCYLFKLNFYLKGNIQLCGNCRLSYYLRNNSRQKKTQSRPSQLRIRFASFHPYQRGQIEGQKRESMVANTDKRATRINRYKRRGRGGRGRDTSPKFRTICHPSEGLRKYLKSSPAPRATLSA